jgi:predicted amidohydrolase
LRVAAVQLNSTAEEAANVEAADRLARAAAAEGAQLIVLPEKWPVLGSDEDLRAGAETLDGPAIAWARALAGELSIDLVAGSLVERLDADPRAAADAPLAAANGRRPPAPRLANTAVHVGPDGEVRAAYRKLHMFDVEVEGRSYRESAVTEPGAEIVTSELADGTGLGLAICYDLRFPELFGALARRGVRVIALPAAFTLPTTRDHWEVLVRARAIENQVFVVAVNQVGTHSSTHPPEHRSGGRSLIVDPWGTVLAQASAEEPGYVVAELDLERQEEIRRAMPLSEHRRAAVYAGEGATA